MNSHWAGRRRSFAVLLLMLGSGAPASAATPADTSPGEYVLRAAGCVACHTDVDAGGAFLAGGRALETPFGTFYSPNITPDPSHGIGSWTEEQFVAALTLGVGPDDEDYYPIFPYTSYTGMQPEDARALWAHLKTVPAVERPNRPHELPWYMRYRVVNWVWKWLFFEPGAYQVDAGRSQSWNRGAYLVRALAHCGECHTPRTWYGAMDEVLALAGTKDGPDAEVVPNITPDEETGIGHWSAYELKEYLGSGMDPDGDFAGGLMAEVIDDGLQYLHGQDIDAIVEYLRSLAPIHHAVETESEEGEEEFF